MTSQSTSEHRASAGHRPVACAVLTVSDTRTEATDEGGPLVRRLLEAAGHRAIDHAICRDEPEEIRARLHQWIAEPEAQVILTTGGTGVGRRDTTIEIVNSLLTARLDGFGELFRMLSFKEVGAAAMLSRATAGLVARDAAHGGDTFIFAMPGSINAVETAMTNLIAPELAHLVWERKK